MARDDRDEDDETEPHDRGAELEESRMPFLSHLRELRDRVRNAALFFMLGFIVCFVFADQIYDWLREPLFHSWAAKNAELLAAGKKSLGEPSMHFGSLTEPFWVNMSVAMWAGIFVASPFIFYQLWKFIAPGLYKRERRITVTFALFSAVMFSAGAVFCFYFVLPNLYDFLLDYASYEQKPVLMMQMYLDLTRDMMLAFGAVFELPLLIYFLAMVGLVTHRGLWKFNRWFVVLAFIIGAILTPSPDVVSQIMMAGPMIILYNVSILLAWGVTSKREKAAEELRAKEAAADEEARAKRAARKAKDAEAQAKTKELAEPERAKALVEGEEPTSAKGDAETAEAGADASAAADADAEPEEKTSTKTTPAAEPEPERDGDGDDDKSGA